MKPMNKHKTNYKKVKVLSAQHVLGTLPPEYFWKELDT